MNDAIQALLHPKSIAVIGASSDFNKINGRTLKALVDKKYAGRILPVYSLTEGLNQTQMRRIMAGIVETYGPLVEDVFPDDFLDMHQLWPIRAALPQIHLPRDQASLEESLDTSLTSIGRSGRLGGASSSAYMPGAVRMGSMP